MRSIIKIAIGTALGILLAGFIAALVVFGLIGAAINDGSDDRETSSRAASVARGHDTDGDGQPDTADPDPYSANSASYKATPEPTPEPSPKKTRSVARTASAAFVACDANISVKAATTTCPFAQNVFYGYWQAGGDDFTAYSPASKRSYDLSCSGEARIVCTAGDGAEVRFSGRAVALYDQAQADAYAASHDLGPDADKGYDGGSYDDEIYDESYDDEIYGDESYDDDAYDYGDEGYNDGDGSTEPGENIPYYDEGDGYRVQCEDGTYSQSGGIQGACSHHGGVR